MWLVFVGCGVCLWLPLIGGVVGLLFVVACCLLPQYCGFVVVVVVSFLSSLFFRLFSAVSLLLDLFCCFSCVVSGCVWMYVVCSCMRYI